MTTAVGTIGYETRDRIGYIRLEAPPHNILTGVLMDQLTDALDRAAADRRLVGVALSSEGIAFSAGADVHEHRPEAARAMIAAFSRLFARVGSLELPVVMAVDGVALGAGFELAMMADVLIATPRAKFGQPEIRLGFFAPVAVAWLSQRVGIGRAVELCATGRTRDAASLQEMGLVSQVVTSEELGAAVESVLADFRMASAAVMRLNLRCLRRLHGRPFEEARQEAERLFLDELMALDDVREGIASFYEKRRPAWVNG
ncbi:MAG: enoyl-CoA hydratase/isomerase family protein [Gemmatimonadales bacterium]